MTVLYKRAPDLKGLSRTAKDQQKITISIDKTKLNGIQLVTWFDGREKTVNERGGVISTLAMVSKAPRYMEAGIDASAVREVLEKIPDMVESRVLGYSSDYVQHRPVEGFEHRAFEVSSNLRKTQSNIATKLYNTHNAIRPRKKEVAFTPSILGFYLRQGFRIHKIHFHCYPGDDDSKPYPGYELDEQQQSKMYAVIRYFLEKGYTKLPFFVELLKDEAKVDYSYIDNGVSEEIINELERAYKAVQEEMGTDPGYMIFHQNDCIGWQELLGLSPILSPIQNKNKLSSLSVF